MRDGAAALFLGMLAMACAPSSGPSSGSSASSSSGASSSALVTSARAVDGGPPPPSAALPPPSASARAVASPSSPQELDNAVRFELDDAGWSAILLESAADAALARPAILVSSSGGAVERLTLPFSSAGDLKGSPRLFDAGLGVRRFIVAEGKLPNMQLRVWEPRGYVGDPVEGTFPLIGGAAITKRQAIAVMGKLDRRGWVESANATRAARHRDGVWSIVDLPAPPEKTWVDCRWDATAAPAADFILLAQMCVAPKHPRAYALYRLDAGSDTFEPVPFDNDLFTGLDPARGMFGVEADGTIDVGSQNLGKDDGEMELARLRPGKSKWEIVRVKIPTRLATTACAAGDRIVVTDAGTDVRESSDGGRTFAASAPLSIDGGALADCNASSIAFKVYDRGPRRSHMVIRPWSR